MKTIQLTQGKVALVDDDDFEIVDLFNWHFSRCYLEKGYATARPKKDGPLIRMHRFIMREELKGNEHLFVDHIDRDTLNNQKSNLRIVTPAQNAANRSKQSNNTSGVTGVAFCKRTRKWKVNFKGQSRGYFVEFEDAVAARKFIEQTEGVF